MAEKPISLSGLKTFLAQIKGQFLPIKNGNVTVPGELSLNGTLHAGTDVKVGEFDEFGKPLSGIETNGSLRVNGTIENWGEVKHHGSVEVEQLKVSNNGGTGTGGSIVADGSISAKDIKASGSIEAGGTMRAKGDLKTSNGLYPEVDNTTKIGKADHRYNEAYITTVHGNLYGDAGVEVLSPAGPITLTAENNVTITSEGGNINLNPGGGIFSFNKKIIRPAATFIVGNSGSGHSAVLCDYLCDGTADQAEIQAAINALPASGGKVVLLEGTYSISGSININKPNVTIEGMGKGTVLERAADNFTLLSINSDNVTVRDLSISGKRTVYTSGNNYGISGTRSHNNAHIQNVAFDACAEGLRITQNNNIIINSCRFVKCTRAIYFDYVFTSAVVDNFVENCDQGIYIDWGSSKNIVEGNVLQISDGASGGKGIYLTASGEKGKYNIVASNSVFNYNYGIDIAGNYNKIVGNYVMRGSGQSSDYTASQYTIISGGTYNDISDNYIPGKNYTNSGGSTNTFDNNRYQ